jgi:hypothetical protein
VSRQAWLRASLWQGLGWPPDHSLDLGYDQRWRYMTGRRMTRWNWQFLCSYLNSRRTTRLDILSGFDCGCYAFKSGSNIPVSFCPLYGLSQDWWK